MDIGARGYGSTEVWVGSPYNPFELGHLSHWQVANTLSSFWISARVIQSAPSHNLWVLHMRWYSLLMSIVVGSRAGKTIRTRVNYPRWAMAVSSRRRDQDLWIRPNRWCSHHPIRWAPKVKHFSTAQPAFADRPPSDSVTIRFPDFIPVVTEKEAGAGMLPWLKTF